MVVRKSTNTRVAIMATDGFEQSELVETRRLLADAGIQGDVIAPASGTICGWTHGDWGDPVAVDVTLAAALSPNYAALVLPGGVINPDRLRLEPAAVDFIRQFARAGKPIAAICHGPQLMIEADIVRGRRITSWPSIKTDLLNAGARWEDGEVVQDRNLITSRKPADIPAFVRTIAQALLPEGALKAAS